MVNRNPEISVIMSVYNHENSVGDAIDSIINQTFQNFEFIIINDGSSDGSLNIINKYKKLDSRIIVIDQKNLGLTKSLNIGLQKSKANFIARQDADDCSHLRRLEAQLKIIKKFQLDIITSRAIKNSKIVPHSFIINCNQQNILKTGNIFIHGTFFFRKYIFYKQKYDEKYKYAQDFKFMLDIFKNNFKVGYILKPLYFLSNDHTSISNTKKYEQDKFVSKALKSFYGSDKYI
jgi:glycosyltransferase involved in cell wall biosynthesis